MLSLVIYLVLTTTLWVEIIVRILEMWNQGLKSDMPKVTQRLGIEFRFKTRWDSCCHDALNSLGTTLCQLHGGPSHTPLSPTSLSTDPGTQEALGDSAHRLHFPQLMQPCAPHFLVSLNNLKEPVCTFPPFPKSVESTRRLWWLGFCKSISHQI